MSARVRSRVQFGRLARWRRRLIGVVAIGVMCLAAACGSGTSASSGQGSETDYTIGIVGFASSDVYSTQILQGLETRQSAGMGSPLRRFGRRRIEGVDSHDQSSAAKSRRDRHCDLPAGAIARWFGSSQGCRDPGGLRDRRRRPAGPCRVLRDRHANGHGDRRTDGEGPLRQEGQPARDYLFARHRLPARGGRARAEEEVPTTAEIVETSKNEVPIPGQVEAARGITAGWLGATLNGRCGERRLGLLGRSRARGGRRTPRRRPSRRARV